MQTSKLIITLCSSLKEFGDTESANLSVRDFREIWIETETNPPSFIKNRKNQKTEDGDTKKRHEEIDELDDDDEYEGENSDADDKLSLSRRGSYTSQRSYTLRQSIKIQQTDDSDEQTQQVDQLEGSTLVHTQSQATQVDIEATQVDFEATQVEDESTQVDDEATQVESSSATSDTDAKGDDEPSRKRPLVNPELDSQAKELRSEMEDFLDGALKASEEMGKRSGNR